MDRGCSKWREYSWQVSGAWGKQSGGDWDVGVAGKKAGKAGPHSWRA